MINGRVLVLIALLFAAPAVFAEDFSSLMASGDRYYEKFDNRSALEKYKQAYALNPSSYDALMKVTRAYIDVGEDLDSKESEEYYLNAVEHAEKMLKEYPENAESYFYACASYGKLALFRGGREKVKLSKHVEENCKKSIELDPEFDRAYTALGMYYRNVANLNWFLKTFANAFFGGELEGTNEDAERMIKKAIQLNPSRLFAHYELAETYRFMHKRKEEIKHLKMVLSLPVTDHMDEKKKEKARARLKKLGVKK